MNKSATSREESKSPDRSLAHRLEKEAGLNQAQIRLVVDMLADHIQTYHPEKLPPGTIVHTAVSAMEPAGKPIKDCRVVPILLTCFCDADIDVLREHGSVELRAERLYRFCCEAREQEALLSYEDLRLLLGVDISTVKDLVRRLRDQGLFVPTRGAVKDIGPDPSHKKQIAGLLGRGYSTRQVKAMTNHQEGSIGRYQLQFAMVLYLLQKYPEASHEELRLLSGLSQSNFEAYLDIYHELKDQEHCRPHLERLRNYYTLDPDGLAHRVPDGKAPRSDPDRRLREQNLPTVIRQTVQKDLGTTERVAGVVADDIVGILDDAYRLPAALRPGEAVVFVDAHDPGCISGERRSDRPVIGVKVPLCTDEIKQIWRNHDEPVGRRRARIGAMIAAAANEQGGVMSIANLAELLHSGPSTLAADLRELAVDLHIHTATKGLLEDAGPTLTHKDWIIDLDQHGLTGEQISWLTRHAPISRDRYIETFRRAEALMRLEGRLPHPEELSRVLRLRMSVASQYVDLLQKYHGNGQKSLAFSSTSSDARQSGRQEASS